MEGDGSLDGQAGSPGDGLDSGDTPSDAGDEADTSDPEDAARSLDGDANDAHPDDAGGSTPREAGVLTGAIDVTDLSKMILLGSAAIGDAGLALTPEVSGAVGAAYLGTPYPVSASTSFAVSFSFHVSGTLARKGDGFAFLWHNDPRRSESLGAPGGALGYGGITPSVIIEFDVLANAYDARGNQVAITTNGDHMTAIAEAAAPFSLDDGATHFGWIDYQAATNTLSVFVADAAQRPPTALVTTRLDLHATLGSLAFMGFSAACGNAVEVVIIESLFIEYRP
jgi:hypothetical protein